MDTVEETSAGLDRRLTLTLLYVDRGRGVFGSTGMLSGAYYLPDK